MLKKQESQYIDSNIHNVFHFLELKGSHNFLIGSHNVRNILYANDYDLNANIGIHDTITVLVKVYDEFLQIFEEAYTNPNYYVLDFKCGVHNNEPIRWSYEDMKQGAVSMGNQTITFEECLLMDDNKIKLDLCYIYNDIFTDINCLYNIHIMHNKEDYPKLKEEETNNQQDELMSEIKDLQLDGDHYKAMKRIFSLSMVQGKVEEDILSIMNSDYGIFYRFISFLKLVCEVLEQDFKPIPMDLVKSNLEYIKEFTSHITTIQIEPYLNRLNKIIELKSKKQIFKSLEKLATECTDKINKLIAKTAS